MALNPGLYLVLQRVLGPCYDRTVRWLRIPGIVSSAALIGMVFLLIQVAWVFFRADNVHGAAMILGRILSGAEGVNPDTAAGAVTQGFVLIAVLLIIEVCMSVEAFCDVYQGNWWMRLVAVQSLCWAALLFGSFTGQQFIYFEF